MSHERRHFKHVPGTSRTLNSEGARSRRPTDRAVVLPDGIKGAPGRLIATPESTAAALVAARTVYERQYRSLGLDGTTITTRLRVFDQGRVRIMLGLFPVDGEPIDLKCTRVAIGILRNAAEIWEGLENS